MRESPLEVSFRESTIQRCILAEELEIPDDDDPPVASSDAEASALTAKLNSIKNRCTSSGIEFREDSTLDGRNYISLLMPSGKNKRRVPIYNDVISDIIIKSNFENYKFLSGYDAIYSTSENVIEAGLRPSRFSSPMIFDRLIKKLSNGVENSEKIVIQPNNSITLRPTIEIGRSSIEYLSLCGYRSTRFTIRLLGSRSKQHDQALAELRSYADSILFQIDMAHGVTLTLERERQIRTPPSGRRAPSEDLAYPITHYNEEAMSLYWYAKSASDMPLLKYLAFYQSIEFYFPRYSQAEARKRVSSILKQPTFRPHRDDDLDRLISAIQLSRSGGLGSERSQLRAAVNECISADDMRAFFASKDREEYFSAKAHRLKYHKIPLQNKNTDLRNDVADRIYDIRCKIVHTKNDQNDDFAMILPFSDDANHLSYDIDLVEYVAQCVLISSSGELS